MTAVAWRTSAGTAARLPVARATNLTRTLREYATAGFMIAGLDAEGSVTLDEFELATDPLVLVVGSEGKGLSRLVKQTCDVTVSIPMAGPVESLNASVAAGVVLAEVARQRRALPPRLTALRRVLGGGHRAAAQARHQPAADVAAGRRSPRRSRTPAGPGASDSTVPPTSADLGEQHGQHGGRQRVRRDPRRRRAGRDHHATAPGSPRRSARPAPWSAR